MITWSDLESWTLPIKKNFPVISRVLYFPVTHTYQRCYIKIRLP